MVSQAMEEASHLSGVLVAAGDLDDLAGGAAPPVLLEEPVGDEGGLGPPLVGEEEYARRVAVVTEDLAATLAPRLVVKQLHHASSSHLCTDTQKSIVKGKQFL